MKHPDTRIEKIGTLTCVNIIFLNRSLNIYACAHIRHTDPLVHAHTHSHSCHFAKALIYDSNMTVYTEKCILLWLEEKMNDRKFQRASNLAIDSCYMQEGRLKSKLPEKFTEQIVTNPTQILQHSCMSFHCFSLLKKAWYCSRSVKRPTSQNHFEHFKIHLRFVLNPDRLSSSPLFPRMAA